MPTIYTLCYKSYRSPRATYVAWDGGVRRQEPGKPLFGLFFCLQIPTNYFSEIKYFKNLLSVDNIIEVVESIVCEYAFSDSIKL